MGGHYVKRTRLSALRPALLQPRLRAYIDLSLPKEEWRRGSLQAGGRPAQAKGLAVTQIELSSEELEILCELLQCELPRLDIEIDRTDTHDFKELLKHRRDALRRVSERISEPAHAG